MNDPNLKIRIVAGAITDPPIYDEHRRAINWAATIEAAPLSPGGASRRWWARGRGGFRYLVDPLLVPLDAVEFGADYVTNAQRRRPRRWHGVVASVSRTEIELIPASETPSASAGVPGRARWTTATSSSPTPPGGASTGTAGRGRVTWSVRRSGRRSAAPPLEKETPMSKATPDQTPKAPTPKTPPKKKTAEELAAMPNWQRVRYEFASLPEHRQLRARIERSAERTEVHLRRMKNWKYDVASDGGETVDAVSQARAHLSAALEALKGARQWMATIPDDAKPSRIAPAPTGSAPLKEIAEGSKVRLKGAAAKAEPEYAIGTVTFLKKYGPEKSPRARCVAPDGVKLAVAYRDLSPA